MLTKCRGCNGSGTMRLRGSISSSYDIKCPGCGGDGTVNVPDPNTFCKRCNGQGSIFMQDMGIFDHSGGHDVSCDACGGHGYAT